MSEYKKEEWRVKQPAADIRALAEQFSISPILAHIIVNREITEPDAVACYLSDDLAYTHDPALMKDMDKGCQIMKEKIRAGKKIRIISDYDVDGITSNYILYQGLQKAGADVSYDIPHRIMDGYGMNVRLVEAAYADGVDTIITCDNGIAAETAVTRAKELGMTVIVTDHHEVPYIEENGERKEQLPPALAVVDPKRADDTYPFSGICGGVVALKLIQAITEKTGNPGLVNIQEELLEFAALSTVCDVMELKDENRILVKEGLKRIQKGYNEGLKALMEVNDIAPDRLSAYHLGFVLGPCLNATGRLDTAKRALELLQSFTRADAMTAARELKDLNESRKNLTVQGIQRADEYIQEHHMAEDKVMVIYLPEVHESIAGIIAGKVREKYHHPVFILTKGEDGVKGSGRSIEAYHMYDAMTQVKEYFTKYGGHKLAAGLSMREEDIEPLRAALNKKCTLTEDDFIPKVHIDVAMPMGYADDALAGEFALLEPFGTGNPRPLFAQKGLVFQAGFKMGANKTCARFRVKTPEGTTQTVVFFGDLEKLGAFLDEKYGVGSEEALYAGKGKFPLSVVYQVSQNTYKGKTEVQFVMQNYC